MTQFTEEEAIAYYSSGQWKNLTQREIASMGLYQDRLCMPFDVILDAISGTLNRPVYTHEFLNRQRLQDELTGLVGKPTLQEIIDLIPNEKLLIVGVA